MIMRKMMIRRFLPIIMACGLLLTACGNKKEIEYEEEVFSEVVAKPETTREETETESKARAQRQNDIAGAKAQVQNLVKDSEMVMNGQIGELTVASTKRVGVSIPTYIYFPAEYEAENTYPLIIMFAGFSSAHDNGTHFDQYADAFSKSGMFTSKSKFL